MKAGDRENCRCLGDAQKGGGDPQASIAGVIHPENGSWLVVARDALDRETLKYFVSNVSAGVLLGQLITKPDQRRIPLDRRVTEDCCHK